MLKNSLLGEGRIVDSSLSQKDFSISIYDYRLKLTKEEDFS